MTDLTIDRVAEVLEAMAHPMRVRILATLAGKHHMTLGTLEQQLEISFPVLSSHLAQLKDQNILTSEYQGNEVCYSLADASLQKVASLLRAKYC
ncbi:helix-turn-helix transcriptional regulator [Spirosoma sp. KNUC1025]|uniref:ArsR/SmtB family transcription factor n=1 Tax=Spirosoma sp. KNUC1025 TaxID=2894082 RepID=UPI0038631DBC|nr:metalloregulator ArsR/SmtB family transcription factor [Spirosoma sp. KNUC1025]